MKGEEDMDKKVKVVKKRRETKLMVAPKQSIALSNSPAEMIRLAVSGKANLTDLKELLAIQKDWDANEARKSFAISFAVAQANIATVVKTRLNPQTHSKYADLGDIIKSAQPVYTKEGFSMIFYEGETTVPESIRICADVLHRAGHKETYHYDVPLDGKGIQGNANMIKIHGKSSSTSYGRRYLTSMIWNIPTSDDDGNSACKPIKFIEEKQLHELRDMLISKDLKESEFCKVMKIENLETMPKELLKKAKMMIEGAKRK